ncbi:hypothetical protein, partial [Pseudomonas putida]|uniref:hypothetical protein n=1 Tax=Pseudomonas putida TaxID=303 RepID=UPI002B253CFA
CLIRFVKERLVKSFSSQPRRAFYAFLRACQAFILKFLLALSFESQQLQQLTACPEAFIAARRRIIRPLKSESTPCSEKLFRQRFAPTWQLMKAQWICKETHHGA